MRFWLTFVGGFLAGGLTVAYIDRDLDATGSAVSDATSSHAPIPPATSSNATATTDGLSEPPRRAWAALVRKRESQGDFAGAILVLRDHQALTPDDPPLWLAMARLQKQSGDLNGAIDSLFEYVILEPDAGQAELVLDNLKAILFSRYGREDDVADDIVQAVDSFDRLLRLSPDDVSIHWRLALLNWQMTDRYSAHYHALIAVSDPKYKVRAEKLLVQIGMQSQPDAIAVDLEHTSSGYIVSAFVNGWPVRLLVDTGASVTGLSQGFVDSHPEVNHGPKQPIVLNTAGGSYRTYLVEVEQLSIDNLSFPSQPIAVISGIQSSRFDGLLGLDVLGQFEFFIDQAESALYLKRHR